MRQIYTSGLDDIAGVYSWAGLSSCLGMLGITKSKAALESLARRNDLPVHGGRIRGKPVFFTREDIDQWVRFICGVELDVWLQQLARDRSAGILDGAPGAGGKDGAFRSLLRFRPWRIYAMVGRSPWYRPGAPECNAWRHHGEDVQRSDGGILYATRSAFDAESWLAKDLYRETHRLWRYTRCRSSTESDLHMPLPKNRHRMPKEARTLIGAVQLEGRVYRWCKVPGAWFGLRPDVSTPFLATKRLPNFSEARAYVESHYKKVLWLTWTRRVDVNPVTIDVYEDREPEVPVDMSFLEDF